MRQPGGGPAIFPLVGCLSFFRHAGLGPNPAHQDHQQPAKVGRHTQPHCLPVMPQGWFRRGLRCPHPRFHPGFIAARKRIFISEEQRLPVWHWRPVPLCDPAKGPGFALILNGQTPGESYNPPSVRLVASENEWGLGVKIRSPGRQTNVNGQYQRCDAGGCQPWPGAGL